MRPIAKEFKSNGFQFRLLKREGLVALFEKSKSGHRELSFEVVILQVNRERTFPNGITTPERETMPSDEQWGAYGWTCQDRESAETEFKKRSGMPFPASNGANPAPESGLTIKSTYFES